MEGFPRRNARIEPLNRRRSIAIILPRRGNHFSLSSEERAGVRTGFLFFLTILKFIESADVPRLSF
jgi:hypothetical protein